jgi:hypothetical protein
MRLLLLLLLAFHDVEAFWSNSPSSPLFKSSPSRIPSTTAQSPKILARTSIPSSLVTLRGGVVTDELVTAAYDWCINLGAPAALVAGAVVATLYENVRGGGMDVEKDDSQYGRFAKKLTNMLLLSAFALQIISIFVTTVTGTMLLSRDFSNLKVTSTTALGFLREHFEFEYLTSRLSFLQGLLNWVAGIALEYSIPRKGMGRVSVNMDRFVTFSLATLAFFLLSFYNGHMTFYDNYFQMLSRWCQVFVKRYFISWRPMMILYVPGCIGMVYTGIKALIPTDQDYSGYVREED